MKNNFLNNNGATLLQNKNLKKTRAETRIDDLKQQEQAMISELSSWETKQKKAERLISHLEEVDRFSTKYLAEVLEVEKDQEQCDSWLLELLIENKVEFALQFEPAKKAFTKLVFQKIANRVEYLKNQLRTIQEQLSHQERIFARIEVRRQGRVLLECNSGYRLGCPGVYQCDNCRANYSVVDNNQVLEMQSIPGGQIIK